MIDSEASRIALEYYRALRKEIIARFQMRDRILLAYLTATGVLLGLGTQDAKLLDSLLVLIPFLSFGACTMVAHHSDQVTAYYQYFCTELQPSLSPRDRDVKMFYLSKVAQEHTTHILLTLFCSQIALLCGPPIFVAILNWPYDFKIWGEKETLLAVGTALTFFTAWRAWSSLRYRSGVMKRLFALPERNGEAVKREGA
jgi:hypothetical protein